MSGPGISTGIGLIPFREETTEAPYFDSPPIFEDIRHMLYDRINNPFRLLWLKIKFRRKLFF